MTGAERGDCEINAATKGSSFFNNGTEHKRNVHTSFSIYLRRATEAYNIKVLSSYIFTLFFNVDVQVTRFYNEVRLYNNRIERHSVLLPLLIPSDPIWV